MQSKANPGDPRPATETSVSLPARRRRRWTYIAGAVAAAVLLAGAGAYGWLRATSTVSNPGVDSCAEVPVNWGGSSRDGQALADICATMNGLVTAWGENDAEGYGAWFTDDATYTTWVGTHYAGRDDIVRSHRALFEGPLAGTRLVDRYLSLRFVTGDVALLTTRGDTYKGDVPDSLAKIQSYTLVRQDDTWRVAAFHNTERGKVMERIQFLWYPETRPTVE
ncbi:SgcJ/EcaC family oxidoreductase [Nocardia carnea]|uniref:SgcJ/EcaC family oxidoreductase n=1 Tax=Nocardia carnea TaxID=37328 RepID=UPI0024566C01|nr:SgcJ/EcaC family oxidoreductase [Nocardia carnea]